MNPSVDWDFDCCDWCIIWAFNWVCDEPCA
ncbi:hypothetical protein P4S72_26180 [Vibrio sp. PP-XX7]